MLQTRSGASETRCGLFKVTLLWLLRARVRTTERSLFPETPPMTLKLHKASKGAAPFQLFSFPHEEPGMPVAHPPHIIASLSFMLLTGHYSFLYLGVKPRKKTQQEKVQCYSSYVTHKPAWKVNHMMGCWSVRVHWTRSVGSLRTWTDVESSHALMFLFPNHLHPTPVTNGPAQALSTRISKVIL